MNAKHTRGPWRAVSRHVTPRQGEVVAPVSDMAVVAEPGVELGKPADDARLIAAAPELLEALQAIAPFIAQPGSSTGAGRHSEHARAADKVHAAIAKATGSAS